EKLHFDKRYISVRKIIKKVCPLTLVGVSPFLVYLTVKTPWGFFFGKNFCDKRTVPCRIPKPLQKKCAVFLVY
ncbi:MAG: hypothetical protein ACYC38_03555, partial [Eubacteriales bacterium]